MDTGLELQTFTDNNDSKSLEISSLYQPLNVLSLLSKQLEQLII